MKTQPAAFRAEERKQEGSGTYVYLFRYGATGFFFTSYDADISVTDGPVSKMNDPQTFTACGISHTRPDESIDALPSAVTITLPANDPQLERYLLAVSPKVVEVFIWRVSSASLPGPLDYDDDLRMVFAGQAEAIMPSDGVIAVMCSPLTLRDDVSIPNYFYQKECNHVLYSQHDGGCKVNKALFTTTLTIDTINLDSQYIEFNSVTTINVGSPARSVTITAETFHGGPVEDTDGNVMTVLRCQILTGPDRLRLWLSWIPFDLEAGDSVDISCGCLLIRRVCHTLFNNLPNFGGTPYVPKNNPTIDGINA